MRWKWKKRRRNTSISFRLDWGASTYENSKCSKFSPRLLNHCSYPIDDPVATFHHSLSVWSRHGSGGNARRGYIKWSTKVCGKEKTKWTVEYVFHYWKKNPPIIDFWLKIYDYINFRNANCVRGSWPLKVIWGDIWRRSTMKIGTDLWVKYSS